MSQDASVPTSTNQTAYAPAVALVLPASSYYLTTMSVRDLPETSEIGDGFGLASYEVYWRELCPFLESRGYVLRPRYQPGWKRSWEALNIPFFKAEDHISLPVSVYTAAQAAIVH